MNNRIPKALLASVGHSKYAVHSFTSLARATGYTPLTIRDMYAAGKIKILCSRIEKRVDLIVTTHDEVARLKTQRSKVPFLGSKQRVGMESY